MATCRARWDGRGGEEDSCGEEGRWYPFSSSQHRSSVICLHIKQPRPGPCTSGFPVTRAAGLKPSDFPGGARPSLGPPPAVRNPVVPGGFVASGTDGEGLSTGTACPGACGSTPQAWGTRRSLHGMLSERCRSLPASRQLTFRCVAGDCFHPTP